METPRQVTHHFLKYVANALLTALVLVLERLHDVPPLRILHPNLGSRHPRHAPLHHCRPENPPQQCAALLPTIDPALKHMHPHLFAFSQLLTRSLSVVHLRRQPRQRNTVAIINLSYNLRSSNLTTTRNADPYP